MKAVSRTIGGSETQVRDWLNRDVDPGIDKFVMLAAALGVSPTFLLQGDERFEAKVPLIGVSSGSEKWLPFAGAGGAHPQESVRFDAGSGDSFAIEIRGDEMSPTYRDGEQIVCQRATHIDNMIGRDCALRTKDGATLIKILDRGSTPGRYTLRSYNPLSRPIENVELDWAAPVMWVKRA